MNTLILNNGLEIPILGYGVYKIKNDECERCVLDAIDVGYRLIDTAQVYGNEEAVGSAIVKSGIDRKELFITTKVWISNGGYNRAMKSIDESLNKLQSDYIDLLLIHQPFNDYYGTYRAMEECYRAGKLKAIGVSNFYSDRLIDLCQFVEVKPQVNQIETHVFNQQTKPHEIMEKYQVQHQSWGPFAEGRNDFFNNHVLSSISTKYNKSTAQIALRYLIQCNVIVIPKSVNKERMRQNFEVFDFQLDEYDMTAILALDENKTLFFSHQDPSLVETLTNRARGEMSK